MTDSVSGILLKILKKHDIKNIFCLPAAQLGMVMDGVSRDPYFNYITTRHEEAAGHMAHAIGKLTNSMGVCFGTVGPGATNMVPGVAAAWADNIPLLVLTPNNPSRTIDPGRDQLQGADHIGLYKSITKWSATIRYADRAAELIERAIHIARSGRPGPVHLDIPVDIGASACEHDLDSIPSIKIPRPAPSGEDMDAVMSLLSNASRPVLIAGGGVARSDGTEEFRDLVRTTGFPATTTMNGRGIVQDSDKAYIGCGGILGGHGALKALQEADVILAVGCKFSSWMAVNKQPMYPPIEGQKIIQVDIDNETLGRTVPLAVAVQADAREFLTNLNARLPKSTFNVESKWVTDVKGAYHDYRKEINDIADQVTTENTNILNEAAAMRTISTLVPEDAIVVVDGGQTMEWGHSFLRPTHPKNYLFVPGMGHLGFGLPFANSAKLLNPDRTVVLVTGDGAMCCTGQELETAARNGLNVITIVFNDSAWGMYRPFGELLFDNEDFGQKLTNVKFADMAKSLGCIGEEVTLETLPDAFRRAQKANRPTVLDLQVDFTPHPMDFFWLGVIFENVEFAPVMPG
ncbi:MAG: thiamine pyrophosphate-binding protein [Emcibacter sp.]|nr:thiamine pyrophosphate-binding protein [Emcibacter sp.]